MSIDDKKRGRLKSEIGKMTSRALTDLIIALLHEVADPRRRHHRGHLGGRLHRRTMVASTFPPPLPPSAVPHRRVLERPPSPSPD
jgi:hypothetical protein